MTKDMLRRTMTAIVRRKIRLCHGEYRHLYITHWWSKEVGHHWQIASFKPVSRRTYNIIANLLPYFRKRLTRTMIASSCEVEPVELKLERR